MENASKLYFTKEQLANTPSRKCAIDANKELSYRQQAANFIQDMGQRLQVSQLCINTAIVYMHRFYVFHSFSEVHRNSLSVAALFLAAKVEEQPRKLEHVIKVAHVCLHKDSPQLDVRTDAYLEKQFEVVAHENVLLQTLGFVLAIEHPHTYVVKVCQLVKASKDLAQTSYFMATTSLHMTTMCLQYKPTLVACVCIHLACKWSSWKIEPCSEGKEWYYYVDRTVTLELLETLTQEFILILETSPHRFKRKFMAQKDGNCHGSKSLMDETFGSSSSIKHLSSLENKIGLAKRDTSSPGPSTSSLAFSFCLEEAERQPKEEKQSPKKAVIKQEQQPTHSISLESYREKREKERLEQKTLAESIPKPPVQKLPPEPKAAKVVPPARVNHQLPKLNSEPRHAIPPKSSGDPVVLLERVTVKQEPKEDLKAAVSRPSEHRLLEGIVPPIKEETISDRAKHQKYKVNSLQNSHESKTNGSKEDRHERHRNKHSGRSSKEKQQLVNNHSEPIKVKIRRDIIRLPLEIDQPPKQPGIKIKLKTPTAPTPAVAEPTPLKLVITKDKSGSGSYSTRRNESHKRGRSPNGARDPSSAKRPHHESSKSSKHRPGDSSCYGNNLQPELYSYKQFYPYQLAPPLPPAPPPPPPPPPLQ